MDIFAFLFVIITVALVVAFWAELRGVFDVEDENILLPALRPKQTDAATRVTPLVHRLPLRRHLSLQPLDHDHVEDHPRKAA
jgi:hypothetical protein